MGAPPHRRLMWEPLGSGQWVALTQGTHSIALTIRTDGPKGTVYEQTRAWWNGQPGQSTLWS